MKTSNELDNELVNGSSSADTIENYGQYVSVKAGSGNDSIVNYNNGENSFIDGEAGNDTIEALDNDYVTVNGGAGADQINGVYYNSSINGGAGNDIVEVELAEISTVEGGDGNDQISGVFVGSEVDGGKGTDLITLQEGEEISQENTVKGGAGNDTIINEVTSNYEDEEEVPGNVYQYANGDGNDVIYGINVNDTLQITSGSVSKVDIGDEDVVLTIGTGKITLKDAAGKSVWMQTGNGNAVKYPFGGDTDDTVVSSFVEGTSGADYLTNESDDVTISALAGNDTVENSGANVSISGGAGADVISNTGEGVTINGDAGNDVISNSGTDAYIDGGAGNDNITNEEDSATIIAGLGNDTITNSGNDVVIDGGDGTDIINNSGSNVTIQGGGGNDLIYNEGENVVYDYAGSSDTVNNSGSGVAVANGGKDTIEGYNEGDEIIIGKSYDASISGNDWVVKIGSGSITVKDSADKTLLIDGVEIAPPSVIAPPAGWKYGTSSKTNTTTSIVTATLATGAENLDLTEAYGVEVEKVDGSKLTAGVSITGNDLGNSIKGGKGADTIYSGSGNDTVSLGAGANVADYYVYTGGDDVIYDYGTGKDTIQIIVDDMDDITMETVGANVLVQTTAGTITLQKATGKDIVLIDANGDEINFDTPITLTGTAKGETLTNPGNGNIVAIDALAGNDKVINNGDEVSISGGAGNDSISNTGDKVTINAGKGNDSIYNEGTGNLYQYASGEGKDTVVGFSENDTLTVTSGSYTYDVSGNDFVVKVGSGTITLKDAAGQIIHLNDEVIEPSVMPNGWKYSNSQKTAMQATLAGAENIDLNESYGKDVTIVDGSKVAGGVEIIGNDEGNSIKTGKGNDLVIGGEGNDTVSLGSGQDTYIYQGGDDVIQDYKAGDDIIQLVDNDQTIVSASVTGSDVVLYTPNGQITVKKGNTQSQILVVNADGEQVYPFKDSIPSGWKLDTNKKTIIATVKTADAEVDLTQDYGDGITIVDASKITDGVVVTGNDSDNSIKGTKGDDVIAGGDGNDTVSLGAGADVYIYSGGDDVIQDFVAGTDSIQIDTVNSSFDPETGVTTEGTNLVITTGTGTLTILKGKDKAVTIVDAEDNVIYPLEADFPPEGWTLDSTKKKITASANADNLDLSIDNTVAANVEKVDASKITSGVEIIAHDDGVSVKGGKGADTVFGGAGNDTVSLGAGADVYVYNGGDDIIQDYVAGVDSIQIDTSQVNFDPETGVSTLGADVIISTDDGKGNLRITKGSGKKITIIDETGSLIYPIETLPEGWKYDSTHKQIKANTTANIDPLILTEGYGAGVQVVDAASAKVGVEITGNDDNNSIRGSKYDDLIIGGSGNDSVSLGGGADTYIYNGGDDILQDYAAADVIQINTKDINVEQYTASGTDFKIITESGTLTITKGASKDITVVDHNGTVIYPKDEETLPTGWKYDTAKTMVSATLKAPDNIDLTEDYGANVKKVDASKSTIGVEIIGNNSGNSIKGGSGEDTIFGGTENDTVSLGGGADVYIYQGGDDLIQDYANVDIVQADTGDITFTAVETIGSNVVYTTDAGTLTFKGAKTKTITLLDMDGNDIVIGPDTDVSTVPAGWSLDSSKTSMKATLKTAADIDLTESYGVNVTKVDAASITGGVEIIGNGLSNSIKGGKGADTIYGGEGNDTVSLGGGADVYVYSEGDDLIQDYAKGQDVIKFETEITSSSVSGSNVVISTDKGKVTVKGMKGKEIEVIDSDGEAYTFTDIIDKGNEDTVPTGWKLDTSKKTLTATVASAENEIDLTEGYGESVTKVDGSKITGGFEIVGNDNSISVKGGKGNDTLAGGEGNDTLTGGNGNDWFIYTGGNDVITDYKAGQDSIQINTTNIDIIEKYTTGSNVVISTEQGNLTITKGSGIAISLYNEDGEELFFDDDGSFVSANTIDEITALTDDNYSQGKINLGSEADILNPDADYIAASYNQDEDK